jgi:CubicO group peptidase (beta-lactamase class C family)
VLTYGYILGEIIRRVCGQPVQDVLTECFLQPLGLRDTYLGLPVDLWERRAEVYRIGGVLEWGSARLFNRRRFRQAVIPAASISSTARDVALFHEMVRCGGALNGVRILQPETVAEARRPSSESERDRATGWRARWAHGFHLGGASGPGELAQTMGLQSDPETFGHSGSQCCMAWVDPGRELVFVYLSGRLLPGLRGVAELGELSDLTLAACR